MQVTLFTNKMKNWILITFLVFTESIFYHFGYNFGQVFKDRSGSGNYAINGDSESTLSFDTKPTDRGAYFSGTTYITCPPNSKSSSIISLSSSFTILLWAISEKTEGVIWNHQKDSTNFMIILRTSSDALGYRFVQSSYDTGLKETASTSFKRAVSRFRKSSKTKKKPWIF